MPVPRSRVSPIRTNGSGSSVIAAISARSTSGASARGSGLSRLGMSLGNSNRPGARSAQSPQCEVVEEAPQIDDGAFTRSGRDGLRACHSTAPGPNVVVGEEVLDVCPGQLGQTVHCRVLVCQVLGEGDQAVGTQLDRPGSQGR